MFHLFCFEFNSHFYLLQSNYTYRVYYKIELMIPPPITDTPIIIRHNPIRPVPVIAWRPFSSLDITATPVNKMAKPIVVALIGIENHIFVCLMFTS